MPLKKKTCLLLVALAPYVTSSPAGRWADGTAPIPHPPMTAQPTLVADGTAPIPHPPLAVGPMQKANLNASLAIVVRA